MLKPHVAFVIATYHLVYILEEGKRTLKVLGLLPSNVYYWKLQVEMGSLVKPVLLIIELVTQIDQSFLTEVGMDLLGVHEMLKRLMLLKMSIEGSMNNTVDFGYKQP